MRAELLATLELRKLGGPAAQDIVVRHIKRELQHLVEKFQEYNKPGGVALPTEGVPDWVRDRCWDTMDGRYIGTDSNLPSRYMDILGHYLKEHQGYLERNALRNDSVRIIFAEQAGIEKDREAYQKCYREFVEWHKENEVKLLILSLSRAKDLAKEHGTTGVTDMACWDREAILLWRYQGDGGVRLQMTFVGEDLYERCRSFLDAVMEYEATKVFPGAERWISPGDNSSASSEEGLQERVW